MEIIITCPSVIKTFNSLVSKCPYNAINGLQMQWGQILWEIIIFNCPCIFTRFYVTFKSMYVLQSFFQFQIRKCWVPWINHQVWKFASEVMAAIVSKQAGSSNQSKSKLCVSKKTVYNSWQKGSFEKQNSLCATVSVISLKVGTYIWQHYTNARGLIWEWCVKNL